MKAITHSRWFLVTALLGAAFLPLPAGAEEVGQAAPVRAGDMFGIAAVDSEDLAISCGGAELDITLNEAKASGVVSGNQASNLTTGNNYVNDSFAGASGFSTVVQNSGNNVLIQNATVINLRVQ